MLLWNQVRNLKFSKKGASFTHSSSSSSSLLLFWFSSHSVLASWGMKFKGLEGAEELRPICTRNYGELALAHLWRCHVLARECFTSLKATWNRYYLFPFLFYPNILEEFSLFRRECLYRYSVISILFGNFSWRRRQIKNWISSSICSIYPQKSSAKLLMCI